MDEKAVQILEKILREVQDLKVIVQEELCKKETEIEVEEK